MKITKLLFSITLLLLSLQSHAQFGGLLNNLKTQVDQIANEITKPISTPLSETPPTTLFKKCTVNPGQAGVTTFLDEKVTKVGTEPIRDFDPYEFRAEKTINVTNKYGAQQVLVGSLWDNSTSKVVEQKSFAMADEWTCK